MMTTMMQLGPIRFSIGTAAYQNFRRSTEYRWVPQQRLVHPLLKHLGIGGTTYQYVGPGDDTIDLDGTMYPQFNGSSLQLTLMRLSAGIGIALPLIESSGFILGRWIITQVEETDSIFFADGNPRKIEFKLSLKRYNEDLSSIF